MKEARADYTNITTADYEQFIGHDVAAFVEDRSGEYIEIVDRDGRAYHLVDPSEEVLYRILPCLKEAESLDYEPFQEDSEDDAYYLFSGNPCKGWYTSDQRLGPMEPARYLWYTKAASALLHDNPKEIDRIWSRHDVEDGDDLPAAIDVIRQVILHDRSKRRRKHDSRPANGNSTGNSAGERIVMLQHAHKNIPFDSPFYSDQCNDLSERIVLDVTSRNPSRQFARQISPMYIGPVITGDGMDAESFELYWQCSKLYPCHAADGQPTQAYWDYRRRMFAVMPESMPNMEKRYPNRMLGYETRDCVCSIWYNRSTGKYERLGYVASRKKEYIPEYARLVHDTDAFRKIKALYDSGRKIALVDFLSFAGKHPEKTFLVTRIGCGIGGFRVEEIAPLFAVAADMPNICLSEDFRKVLNNS